MRESSSLPASHAEQAAHPLATTRVARFVAATDAAAIRACARPGAVLGVLLLANVVLGAAGVGLGLLVGDPALYFRELMPGTLLSAAHIAAAAFVASAIHRRDPRARRWHESFWGLSAALLSVLVVVELAQPTVFLSKWLRHEHGVRAPDGFSDVDGVLVPLLLIAVVAILAPRTLELLRHPRALALFAVTALLAAASQFVDSTARVSAWEFVVEDGMKALAGPFLVVGYLVALRAFAALRRAP